MNLFRVYAKLLGNTPHGHKHVPVPLNQNTHQIPVHDWRRTQHLTLNAMFTWSYLCLRTVNQHLLNHKIVNTPPNDPANASGTRSINFNPYVPLDSRNKQTLTSA
jgi:hypothetical protein